MKKLISTILALCLCAMIPAGCGNQSDSAPSDNTGQHDSIVRITQDMTPLLDPSSNAGMSSSAAYLNLYDTLIFPKIDGEIEPDLAESWESNADGSEYTFKLKKGVKFHDGSELLASDVAFTAKRMIAIGEGFAYLYSGIVKDVIADDDYTVTFKLNKPFGPFVSSLCRLYILNEDLVMANLADGPYGEYGDYGRAWLLQNDAGSGPYMATEMVQNDYFLASKFNDWHIGWEDRENAPEQFKIIYGTEAATLRTMMSTQTLEITDPWQTIESYNALDKLDGVELASFSNRLVQNLYFNCTKAPTDDVNFRKALACLIDYDTIIDVAFTGSEQPAGPVSKFTSGHVDCTQYPYDPEKAKEYLAESKYADNLADYPLEFLQITENAFMEKVALSLQAECKKLGITLEISKAPWTQVQERVSNPDTTPTICCINSGPSYNEAGATLESQFHSKTAGTYENVSWISSPELDARIEDALSTIDQTERYEKYAELQNYITDELCPTAWLADRVEHVAYQSGYLDFPAAEATRNGETVAYLMSYNYFMPDVSLSTDR